jgi:hypothetical protein
VGCDIHPAVEVRRKGVWRYHTPKNECRWYYDWEWDKATSSQVYKLDADGNKIRSKWDRCKYALPDEFKQRNYLNFAILADVRNDGSVVPIAPDRGIPLDADPRTLAKLSDEHSPTWVTLQELLDYDLAQPVNREGYITERAFLEALINRKDPEQWSGYIGGSKVVTVTPEQYLGLFGDPGPFGSTLPGTRRYNPDVQYHILWKWMVPVASEGSTLPEMIEYLKPLIPKGGTPDDVRIVMDFDS